MNISPDELKLLVNPQNHPAIWLPEPSKWSSVQRTNFPKDQKPPTVTDDALWDEFSNRMNQQVPRLNQGLMPLLILTIVIDIVLLVLILTPFLADVGIGNYLIYAVILAVFCLEFFGLYAIMKKNGKIDVEIAKIVEDSSFQNRFLECGIQVEYAIRYMQYGVILRVVLFKESKADEVLPKGDEEVPGGGGYTAP